MSSDFLRRTSETMVLETPNPGPWADDYYHGDNPNASDVVPALRGEPAGRDRDLVESAEAKRTA